MAVPRLALDRPFTYLMPEGAEAGVGTLVSVPFHGRTVRGWVVGPAADVPPGRVLPVRSVVSRVRFFDRQMLELFRWMQTRYLAPLAAVIARSHPPRVASEEEALPGRAAAPPSIPGEMTGAARSIGPAIDGGSAATTTLERYGDPTAVLAPGASTWLRPLPGQETTVCVAAVAAVVATGRQALVLVPEADPVPATATGVLASFPGRSVAFLGGDARSRYRTWLEVGERRPDVVVATRPGVFASLPALGLVWISREAHPGHREDRAPYYHVREVAVARCRIAGAACVVSALSPSADTALAVRRGAIGAARPPRKTEREAAPLTETAVPGAEDRSPRLTALLRRARSAALLVSRHGHGVARVCRSCLEPAACARCGGEIGMERGGAVCRGCGSEGVCRACGNRAFGIERRGAERVAEWAARTAGVPVELERRGEIPPVPGPGRVIVGTAAAVNDVGPVRLDLVALLDADRALRRPGLHAGERTLATWMEAAAWGGPKRGGGRVLIHTRRPGHPAVQALIRWDPLPFLLEEGRRRTEAGFPPGHAAFRIEGSAELESALTSAGASPLLSAPSGSGTICLVAVALGDLPRFREQIVGLAATGVVVRVEAEPQL